MKRVFITGANGFIGRALCKKLFESGYEVIAGVRKSPTIDIFPPKVKICEIGNIELNSILDSVLTGVDFVVHLAARTHVLKESSDDPILLFQTINVDGTVRLACAASGAGVKRFIFISSVGVHGNRTSKQPFVECASLLPQELYAQSKLKAERNLFDLQSRSSMEIVVIRPPLVYGPGNPGNFRQLLDVVATGVPLPFGATRNRRSFIYVSNLVDAIITCLEHRSAAGQIYLVSDGDDISTPDLIRSIARNLGKPVRLLSVPPSFLRMAGRVIGKSAQVERLLNSLVIDSSKICRDLGWKPPYTLEQGLRETVDWFKLC